MKSNCEMVIKRLEELLSLFNDKYENTTYIKTNILPSLVQNAKQCSCMSQNDRNDMYIIIKGFSFERTDLVSKLKSLINSIKKNCSLED